MQNAPTANTHEHRDLSYEEILARCAELLEAMDDMLLGFEPMSPEESRTMPRVPEEAGDEVIAGVAAECLAIDFARADRETTVSGMLAQRERARRLREVIGRHREVLARLEGERRRNEAASWRAALVFYAVLRRVERGAPTGRIGEGLRRVRGFFERGRGRKRRIGTRRLSLPV